MRRFDGFAGKDRAFVLAAFLAPRRQLLPVSITDTVFEPELVT